MAAPMAEEVARKVKKYVEVRVLFNDTVASESFLVPASKASRLHDLYLRISRKTDVGGHGLFNLDREDRPGLYTGNLYPVLFVLQENSVQKHHLRHCRWIIVGWDDLQMYTRWYERVVQGSNQGEIFKVEMRLNMTRDKTPLSPEQVAAFKAMRETLTAAGMGEEVLEWQAPPSMLTLDDFKNRNVWEWHPAYAHEATFNYRSIAAVPPTDEWFPLRDPVSPLVTDGTCVACLKTVKELGVPTMGKKALKKAKAKAKRDAAAAAEAEEGEEGEDDDMAGMVEKMEIVDDGEDGEEDEEEDEDEGEEAGGPEDDEMDID
ncbi:hypothetical protein H2204_001077 [Knufia peltigerae]|uniref:Uncharacterized protein n=1 Tax=Knufia peltigerae TaxID=1002370 RepID=A0AA39D483_9EURO|nr:hypothetical protein H2204_001077 [Knufia peltigerae]